MSQLIKGMYGSCTGFHWHSVRGPSEKFGLFYGQLRGGPKRVAKNNGWYNKKGEKLGYGDLSAQDIRRIAREIAPDELFITLGERASYWNFYRDGKVSSDERAPGIDYIAEHASLIISKGQALCVKRYEYKEGFSEFGGMQFRNLHPDEVKKLIHSFNGQPQ